MYNCVTIDSLKLRIKLSSVKIIDPRFVTDYVAYYQDLESIDEESGLITDVFGQRFKPMPYVHQDKGITYRFFIKSFITPDNIAEQYLVLQVSAKMLKQKYFEGLTLSNYKQIVDDLNALNVFSISYNSFLYALISDIDLCINQQIDQNSLLSAFSLIKQFPNPGKLPLIHAFNVKKDGSYINLGLDFNKREKASNSAPYCKIYHKGIELQTKSLVFYNAFLKDFYPLSRIENLVRYEFTIKARKHKDFLTLKSAPANFKTLNDLLAAPNNDLLTIAKSGLPWYTDKLVKVVKNYDLSALSPKDLQTIHLMRLAILSGHDESVFFSYLYDIECKTARSRAKKHTNDLLKFIKSNIPQLQQKLINNNQAFEFLANLGL